MMYNVIIIIMYINYYQKKTMHRQIEYRKMQQMSTKITNEYIKIAKSEKGSR